MFLASFVRPKHHRKRGSVWQNHKKAAGVAHCITQRAWVNASAELSCPQNEVCCIRTTDPCLPVLMTSSVKTHPKQQEMAKMCLSDLITCQISAIADTPNHPAYPKLSGKAASPYVKQTSKEKPGPPLTPKPLNNCTILKNGLEGQAAC